MKSVKRLRSLTKTLEAIGFSPQFFYFSSFLGLILTFTLSLIFSRIKLGELFPHFPGPLWLDRLTYILDPFAIHFISLLFLCWLIFRIGQNQGWSKQESLIACLIPVAILIMSYLVGDKLFKPSFNYDRPFQYQNIYEPPITRLLQNLFGSGSGVPSGFTMRQIVLYLTFLCSWRHPQSPLHTLGLKAYLIHFLNILFVVLVPLLRIYRNAHSPFDVFMSIGTSIIIFWLIVVPLYALVFEKYKNLIGRFAGIYLLFASLLIFYTQNAPRWIITTVLIVFLLAIIRRISLISRKNQTG